ncbi:hypothetical protein [Chitinimonas naiadis]
MTKQSTKAGASALTAAVTAAIVATAPAPGPDATLPPAPADQPGLLQDNDGPQPSPPPDLFEEAPPPWHYPESVTLAAPYGVLDEDTGTEHHWYTGQQVVDPDQVRYLVEVNAPLEPF